MQAFRRLCAVIILVLLVTACAQAGNGSAPTSAITPTAAVTPTQIAATPTRVGSTPQAPATAFPGTSPTPVVDTSPLACPADIQGGRIDLNCQTPRSERVAYGVESLMQRGYTGAGQAVVDIVSFGSPTLQKDMDTFDQEFGLPPITIQVLSPIGTVRFDPNNKWMQGWAGETELDVQIIHAIAPGAKIVVLTSPVPEIEGTTGLPQFLELEQYAISHHLGSIISQSFGASEATLKDSASQQQLQQWDAFFKQATTQQGITFFGASGDNGATDFTDANASVLATTPTTSFPTDDPWVTSTGGTSLVRVQNGFLETAWNNSFGAGGGGFSSFFATPSYQKNLPNAEQQLLNNRRGVPDVSADADPNTGLAVYINGWTLAGGTSASAPFWAAITAIANQMAGRSLGFLNVALYKLGASSTYARDFHDITSGNNSRIVNGITVPGQNAVPGWDAVTGLGSPNAVNLIPDLIAALQG